MGYPIAERLLLGGNMLTVWNRTLSKAMPLKNQGAQVANTAQEAIESGDIVINMLFDIGAFNEVVLPHTKLLNGKIFVNMATCSPDDNVNLYKTLHSHCTFCESPVLGTDTVAKAGKLQILVGADNENIFRSIEDVLRSMGTPHYMGPIPNGSTMKLAMNNLVIGQTALFASSLALVEKSGLTSDKFMEILKPSAFFCNYYDFKLTAMKSRNFEPHFDVQGALKDMKYIKEAFAKYDIDTSITEGITKLVDRTSTQYSGQDFSVVYNVLNPPQTDTQEKKEKDK